MDWVRVASETKANGAKGWTPDAIKVYTQGFYYRNLPSVKKDVKSFRTVCF